MTSGECGRLTYQKRTIAPRVVSLGLQIDATIAINDTLSGDARLQSFKITSHGVKSKYLGFHDHQLLKLRRSTERGAIFLWVANRFVGPYRSSSDGLRSVVTMKNL